MSYDPHAPQQNYTAPDPQGAYTHSAPQPSYPYPALQAPKSKVAAGLLGILLGCFGVHNFYLGYTGKAVAQLLITVLSLFSLSFVSAVWGVIEGVLILTSQPGTQWHRDANGMELQD